jgi:hypothetical protein
MAKKHKSKKSRVNFKWSVIWFLIHSVSLFIMGYVLSFLNINSDFVNLLIIGFGVTALAGVAKIFTRNKKFVVNKWYLFWSLVNTTTIWLVTILSTLSNIDNYLYITLVTALGLVVVSYLVRMVRITNTKLWLIIILTFLILFFAQGPGDKALSNLGVQKMDLAVVSDNSEQPKISDTSKDMLSQSAQSNNAKSENKGFIDSIKQIFSSVSFNDCPQLPLTMQLPGIPHIEGNGFSKPFLTLKCPEKVPCIFYWDNSSLNSVSTLTNGEWISPPSRLDCRAAKYEGEDRTKIYCDSGSRFRDVNSAFKNAINNAIGSGQDDSIPFIVKKPEEQGDIIEYQKLTRKSFMNIYTKDGEFIETICGKDPSDIQEERDEKARAEFKQGMRELDDLFSI